MGPLIGLMPLRETAGGTGDQLPVVIVQAKNPGAPIYASISCFLTYLAVQTSDQTTRERGTYGLLVVREAMCHGGRGWMDYDCLFRQQAELNSSRQWNVIHPELQATTVLAHREPGAGSFCSVCQECNHRAH